jgi:hypothetical protein
MSYALLNLYLSTVLIYTHISTSYISLFYGKIMKDNLLYLEKSMLHFITIHVTYSVHHNHDKSHNLPYQLSYACLIHYVMRVSMQATLR